MAGELQPFNAVSHINKSLLLESFTAEKPLPAKYNTPADNATFKHIRSNGK